MRISIYKHILILSAIILTCASSQGLIYSFDLCSLKQGDMCSHLPRLQGLVLLHFFSAAVCLNLFASPAKLVVRDFCYCWKYISTIIYHGLSAPVKAAGEVQQSKCSHADLPAPKSPAQLRSGQSPFWHYSLIMFILRSFQTIKKVSFTAF